MIIQTIPIDRLNAAAYNPRVDLQPGDPEYEKLRHSIENFGYVEPIVWNERTGNIVGGHQRYKVLQARGDPAVEVSVVDLDDQQERLLNLALNKVSGRWDEEALARLLDELQAGGAELDLSGFDADEIGELIAGLPTDTAVEEPVVEDDFDVGKALEQIQKPLTRRGDVAARAASIDVR
ncbi:ParB N-terminal domain-containing protein [Cohnella cellulosilytica]|uniref:ParB N-terminal domain-containing protein n=1 Tax=Cohnella cellulosilytica TaxID=986710 RepID=UPI00361423CF